VFYTVKVVSKLDRKTNEYIRCKIDAQDMILDDITRKQLTWYGHVERMDPMRLAKMIIHWKPEGRKKRGHPRKTWKDGIYTAMNERGLRMGKWNNRRQRNMKSEGVVRHFKTAQCICKLCVLVYVRIFAHPFAFVTHFMDPWN